MRRGEGGGRIAEGALADFVVVRTDTVNTAGARAGQVMYCANQSDIDHVFVGGEEVVRHGHHRIGEGDRAGQRVRRPVPLVVPGAWPEPGQPVSAAHALIGEVVQRQHRRDGAVEGGQRGAGVPVVEV